MTTMIIWIDTVTLIITFHLLYHTWRVLSHFFLLQTIDLQLFLTWKPCSILDTTTNLNCIYRDSPIILTSSWLLENRHLWRYLVT